MIKLMIVEGRGLGAKIKNLTLSESLKSSLHEWLKDTRDDIKQEKVAGSHPFGGTGRPATGKLQKSIKAGKPTGRTKIKGKIYTDVEYAPFYEWGKKQRWNKPFIKPIWDRNQPRLSEILEKSIGDIFRLSGLRNR